MPKSVFDILESTDRALTADELARVFSVSKLLIYKLARNGTLPCFRLGTAVRFDPRAVATYLRERGGVQ